ATPNTDLSCVGSGSFPHSLTTQARRALCVMALTHASAAPSKSKKHRGDEICLKSVCLDLICKFTRLVRVI
ncbi:MAG: hypothetical protein WBZ67_17265, partial [Pseudolabrys sp.]